ncbi:MAG: GDP-mannose 4,6 dehydratase, partial [Nanoarchaeota archaeon]
GSEEQPKIKTHDHVTLQIPDCSKFKNETGWEPEIPFEKIMEDLLNFWRQKIGK